MELAPGEYFHAPSGMTIVVSESGMMGKKAHDGSTRWISMEKLADGRAWLQQELDRGEASHGRVAPGHVRTSGEKFADDVQEMADLETEAEQIEFKPPEPTGVPTTSSQEWGSFGGSPKEGEPAMSAAKKALEWGSPAHVKKVQSGYETKKKDDESTVEES
jgi:hypothetical protein